MWFLQRRNTHNQIIILALSIALGHIALLACLFFVYHDVEQHLEFRIMPNMMPRDIEFRVAVERIAAKKGGSGKSSAKAVTLSPAKKMPPKSTKIASPSSKKAAKATPAKKSAPAKAAAKKVEEKKVAPVEQKKAVEKVEEKKIEPVAQTPEQPLPKLVANGEVAELDHINFDLSQKGFPAMFQAEYQALYENLSDQWAPPAGVPVTSQCVITVVVDKEGEVEDMLVDNPSGMMVFDLAARSALSEVEFPRFVWGKSITVTFSV